MQQIQTYLNNCNRLFQSRFYKYRIVIKSIIGDCNKNVGLSGLDIGGHYRFDRDTILTSIYKDRFFS